jgi:hypothetical protein
MKNILKKLTLFFILGIFYIFGGIIYTIILITGNSAQDGLLGIYILFSIIPVFILLLFERFLVRKFGSQKVNRTQFYFVLFIVILWIIRAIANL